MGIGKYKTAIRVLKNYISETGKNFIWTNDLRELIIKEIGGDERRTILPLLKLLRDMNVLQEIEINKWIIKI